MVNRQKRNTFYERIKEKTLGPVHNQPEPFRPTKLGLNVRHPNFPASRANANAYLINYGTRMGDPNRKIYLFVDGIHTSWSISGETAQAWRSRSWYPRNLVQEPLTITGSVANQYEYDRLVRFVAHSQFIATEGARFADDWYRYVGFSLFRSNAQHSFDMFKEKHKMNLIINSIDAGHEVFQFAPTFVLNCKVVNDLIDPDGRNNYQPDLSDYTQVFGNFHNPAPHTADTTPSPATRRAGRKAARAADKIAAAALPKGF